MDSLHRCQYIFLAGIILLSILLILHIYNGEYKYSEVLAGTASIFILMGYFNSCVYYSERDGEKI